jgi:hypothetical protein
VPVIDLTPYYQPQGSTSDGTKFDNALAQIQSTLNNLDNANIVSGAGIALSKLATNPLGLPLSLTGATAATRYVGATASGAPVSGTFAVGDFAVDQTGALYVCTVAGSPGTWTQVGGGSSQKVASVGYLGPDGSGSTAWPSANAAILVPFTLQAAQTIDRLWFIKGGTNSGNFDIGVYDVAGNRKVSKGSTAQSTLSTSVVNEVTFASTPLPAGQYYLALAADNGTGSFIFGLAAEVIAVKTQFQVAASFPLPATITPGSTHPTTVLPLAAPVT